MLVRVGELGGLIPSSTQMSMNEEIKVFVFAFMVVTSIVLLIIIILLIVKIIVDREQQR